MTLNKTAIAAIISLAALTGFSSVAIAQNSDRYGPNMHRMMQPGMAHERGLMANLTPEQQAASKKAFDAFHSKTADLRQQMVSKNYEYNALLTSKTLDESKLQAVSKEINALRTQLAEQRAALDIELAKTGVPMMGRHGGMAGHKGFAGKGRHNGSFCR